MKQLTPDERVRLGRLKPNVVFDCEVCGEHVERYVSPSALKRGRAKGRYCSRVCKGRALSGERHHAWKGGRRIESGYIYVREVDHPHANHVGYVREHRLVMERLIGRYLEPQEVVHHVNGDTTDNRPENLLLFATHAEHKRHEDAARQRDEKGRLIAS